jgi:DNA polymerase III delta subunit
MSSWREVVRDAKEAKIFEALEEPKYQWRTMRALQQAGGMSEPEVRNVIDRYRSLVREARSQSGEPIWTLQERYWKRGGVIQIMDFISHTSTG